jgi:hypothetical protein
VRAGKQNSAPVITCANPGELTGPGTPLPPFLIADYESILDGMNAGRLCLRGKLGVLQWVG